MVNLRAGIALVLAAGAAACGQSIVNGTFDDGTLNGWTVQNTSNGTGAPGDVVLIDIDGPSGPLADSNAAHFMVGLVTYPPFTQQGIEMSQSVTLSAGVAYSLDFDWSAQRISQNTNAEGGVFTILFDGTEVASVAAGDVSATLPKYGHLTGTYTPSGTGPVTVMIRITRPYAVPGDVSEYVDNIVLSGGGPAPCYANCDNSTIAPVLNVLDFNCFLNRFSAGESYANCDGSTIAPVLNVLDFNCFLNRFSAGCP